MFHNLGGFLDAVTSTAVSGDDQFVLEFCFSLDEVVQMHVTVLMNQVPLMIGSQKGQLCDQYLRPIKLRVVV